MTAHKVIEKLNLVADFTDEKVNTNKIYKALRSANIIEYINLEDGDKIAIIHNQIKVGKYIIELVLPRKEGAHKLKDYGSFGIKIKENLGGNILTIKTNRNKLFSHQKWSKHLECNLKIKDLVNVILYCDKIQKLSLFL